MWPSAALCGLSLLRGPTEQHHVGQAGSRIASCHKFDEHLGPLGPHRLPRNQLLYAAKKWLPSRMFLARRGTETRLRRAPNFLRVDGRRDARIEGFGPLASSCLCQKGPSDPLSMDALALLQGTWGAIPPKLFALNPKSLSLHRTSLFL